MGKINIGRLILGGIVAGIVLDVLGSLVDGVWLAPRWANGMLGLGRTSFSTCMLVGFNVLGLLGGIALVWIYAAIRPRFGAGAKTAVYAGLVYWIVNVLFPNLGFMWIPHLFGHVLTAMTTAAGLVEVIAAAIAGAAVYKE